MAAQAEKIIQTVRPHIRLIRFPSRKEGAQDIATTPVTAQTPGTIAETVTSVRASYIKPIGLTPRGSGIEFKDLPDRYKRKPLDQAEIDYVLRGGPE